MIELSAFARLERRPLSYFVRVQIRSDRMKSRLLVGALALVPALLGAQTERRSARVYADVLGSNPPTAFAIDGYSGGRAFLFAVRPLDRGDTVIVATYFTREQVNAWTPGARRTLRRVLPVTGADESVEIESPHLEGMTGSFWFTRSKRQTGTRLYFRRRKTGQTLEVYALDDSAEGIVKGLSDAVRKFP